jgi:signal transduction histidine kinase/sugar lactone lactonase YvrE
LDDNVDHPIYTLKFDHLKNLWLGLFPLNGLLKIPEAEWKNSSKDKLKYKLYKKDIKDSTSLGDDEIWSIKQDKNLNLWIADNDNICRYNYKNDNFTIYKFTHIPKTIEFDKYQNLWVTTRGDGVFYFNVKTNKAKHYTTEQGLCQNFVFGAIADRNDDIWFNTENGLSRFNPKTEKFRNYDVNDGLPSNRFDDRSEKLLPDGKIYMGTSKGFVIFNPNDIKDDTSKSNIVLSGFKISNFSVNKISEKIKGKIIKSPVDQVSKIELSPDQKDFSLEFAALNYAAPQKIKYAYKLDGFDKEWIYTNAQNRIARYTNLDGGVYIFMVKATNCDGVWKYNPLNITIIVHPPFYKTLLFRIIVFLVLLLFIFYIFKWFIGKEVKQKQKLELMVEARTAEIVEKNEMLNKTASDLNNSNLLLKERQQMVEEQKEEMMSQRDELAIINNQKDKLMSIIAHDLKNPFNVIMGYADMLLKNNSKYDEKKREKFLTYLKQSSYSAFFLLENLLQWSRSQDKVLIYEPVPLQIKPLIDLNLRLLNELSKQKEIEIELLEADENITVSANENMINTILRNLLTNAIKFSHPGSKIIVTVSKPDNKFALISVSDFGVGMDKENCANLFQSDKNISKKGTAGEKGTGLGLMLCYDFVKAQNGQIEVESELNKGTKFTFSLPLANQ